MLDVALLGTGGMMPLPNRYLTSMLLRQNGSMMLVDCGEGTQVTMKSLGWGFKNLGIICFTHFHADHISGLPGLLLTLGNSGRTEPVTIIGPHGLTEVLKGLLIIAPDLPFPIHVHCIENESEEQLKIGDYNIAAFPVSHRVACFCYRVDVNRTGKFDVESAEKLNLPKQFWNALQKNQSIEYEGRVFTPDMVLGKARKGIRVAYCTDSRPVAGMSEFVENADLFICEGIYGDDEKLDKAVLHKHMIFREAAKIARDGNVSELWLTHFSPALTDPKLYLQNACNVFYNSKVGHDRMTTTLFFKNE